MKMSDDQFNNLTESPGLGVDFADPVPAPVVIEVPVQNGDTKKVVKHDKKDLQPEHYRKVFVGSLNYTTTDETMRTHFSQYGEIIDCVIMKESKSGKSRGFGFVTYVSQKEVDAMMKARPHKLDGRELETKRATPRDEAGKQGAEISTKKLFVGAIKEGLTEVHLKEYFGKFGKVEDCIVMKDKESGKLRGFGFVSFDDYDPIDKIVLDKTHTVNGQVVAVKKALPKEQTQGGNGNNNNNNGQMNNGNAMNFSGGNNNRGRGGGNNGRGGGNNRNNNRGGGGGGGNNNNQRFNNNNNNNGNNNGGGGGYGNDDFNSNNFGNGNGNGAFNNFGNGNGNGNGNGSNMNGMGNGSGINFALIAQKMLQAANMGGNGLAGNYNGGNNGGSNGGGNQNGGNQNQSQNGGGNQNQNGGGNQNQNGGGNQNQNQNQNQKQNPNQNQNFNNGNANGNGQMNGGGQQNGQNSQRGGGPMRAGAGGNRGGQRGKPYTQGKKNKAT